MFLLPSVKIEYIGSMEAALINPLYVSSHVVNIEIVWTYIYRTLWCDALRCRPCSTPEMPAGRFRELSFRNIYTKREYHDETFEFCWIGSDCGRCHNFTETVDGRSQQSWKKFSFDLLRRRRSRVDRTKRISDYFYKSLRSDLYSEIWIIKGNNIYKDKIILTVLIL